MKDRIYKIKITETLEKTFSIIADSPQKALQIADNYYRSAEDEYVLTGDNVVDSNMEIVEDE